MANVFSIVAEVPVISDECTLRLVLVPERDENLPDLAKLQSSEFLDKNVLGPLDQRSRPLKQSPYSRNNHVALFDCGPGVVTSHIAATGMSPKGFSKYELVDLAHEWYPGIIGCTGSNQPDRGAWVGRSFVGSILDVSPSFSAFIL